VNLEQGTHLGPYEVVGVIGAGGMGEVWRARDTRLSRDVAIKVIPAELQDSVRLEARFTREALAISQLEHPHICRLYDVGREGSTSYLVMELLDGESLADRLARGPLPVAEVLRHGREIAAALHAAHQKGIVHRDLKPGNVMITRSGAKLLDFGLSKSGSNVVSGRPQEDDPTQQKPLTAEGTIVGTFQYMAPEQLEGLDADPRTDIFALGAVLYEMATGRRAFSGTSRTSLIAAIVASQPEPIASLQPMAPLALDHVVRKCLEKRPDDRWQSAHDVATELQWIGEVSSIGQPAVAPASRRWKRLATPLLIALALVAGAAAGWLARRPVPAVSEAAVVRSQIALPEGSRIAGWGAPNLAISRDGRTMAFVATDGTMQRLYLRRLDRAEAVLVPGSESAEGPFFSPDGRHVAFAVSVSGFGAKHPPELRAAPVSGGLPRTICPLEDYFGGAWSEDGTIFFAGRSGNGLWRVPAVGGEPARHTADGLAFSWPMVTPGGKAILVTLENKRSGDAIVIVDPASGAIHDLGIDGQAVQVLDGGRLVYVRSDRKMNAIPFDAAGRRVIGRGVTLLDDIAMTGPRSTTAALSPGGTLLYLQGYVTGSSRELSRFFRTAADGKSVELPFGADTWSRRGISVSPDGSRFATTADERLSICDLRRGSRLELPQPEHTGRSTPLWTPDGKSVVFTGYGAALNSMHLFVQSADGTSAARKLTGHFPLPFEAYPTSWASDSDVLFNYTGPSDGGVNRLSLTEPAAPRRPVLVQERSWNVNARTSPDRRWIAYEVRGEGTRAVFVRRLEEHGSPVMVAAAGHDPRWSPDGRTIYFRDGDAVLASSFAFHGTEPDPAPPRRLFELSGLKTLEPIPGASDFITVVEVPGSGIKTTLSMIQHFEREIEAAMSPRP
jgi:Tol biopolymer transport system component